MNSGEIMLWVLYTVSHLILTRMLGGRHDGYSHIAGEETEAWRDKDLGRGYTARQWKSWDPNPVRSASKPIYLTCYTRHDLVGFGPRSVLCA